MFGKFEGLDSADEVNRAAAVQRKEGDNEAVLAIAEENGIDKKGAMDFIDGYAAAFVTPFMTAYGELNIEAKELKPYEIMKDWLQYIRLRCMGEPETTTAVRRKGKGLKGCIAALLEWSMKSQHPVDSDTLKMAKINYKVTLGISGMGRAKKIITKYCMGKEQ